MNWPFHPLGQERRRQRRRRSRRNIGLKTFALSPLLNLNLSRTLMSITTLLYLRVYDFVLSSPFSVVPLLVLYKPITKSPVGPDRYFCYLFQNSFILYARSAPFMLLSRSSRLDSSTVCSVISLPLWCLLVFILVVSRIIEECILQCPQLMLISIGHWWQYNKWRGKWGK